MRCTCGAELPNNASFCGKCGQRVQSGGAACPACGNALPSGAMFCGACGHRIAPRPMEAPFRPYKPEPDRTRARKVLIIALVIGLVLTSAGLAGKIVMDGVASKLVDNQYFGEILSDIGSNEAMGKKLTKLLVCIIKDDSQGYINAISDDFGPFFSFLLESLFTKGRPILIENAGSLWPLLQLMAYFPEMLTIGLILAVLSTVILFLIGTKWKDILELRLQTFIFLGLALCALILIGTIVGKALLLNSSFIQWSAEGGIL